MKLERQLVNTSGEKVLIHRIIIQQTKLPK